MHRNMNKYVSLSKARETEREREKSMRMQTKKPNTPRKHAETILTQHKYTFI